MNLQTLSMDQADQKSDSKTKLKTLFITLPQRDTPGTFPPFGPMAVMTYLKKAGYTNLKLYNMDLARPSRQEAVETIEKINPDVLCISAPVSTSYENCKYYSLEIKKRLPHVPIILGGNLAASAEIILKRTGVDYCVLGEGEVACKKLFDVLTGADKDTKLSQIHGLGYLENGEFVNTGHADQLPMEEVYDVDWRLLDEQSRKNCFQSLGEVDPGSVTRKYFQGVNCGDIDPDKLDKTIGIIACSKGCVARCTFCHRFQKGIRFIPPEILIERMDDLIENYRVGVFEFADECFGADLKWLYKFCAMVKPFNVLWHTTGMRVKQITPEIIAMMKDSGCRSIIYGMETGSERMIEVMEKRASIEDNIRAFKLTLQAGLYTIPQLIIGMPGENTETVLESADFVAKNMILDRSQNPREVSINYAQALPGTPLYEYARHHKLIGESLDDEEEYLMYISDRNACDDETTLNFTEYPRLTLVSWRNLILTHIKYEYAKAFGMQHYYEIMFDGQSRPSLWSMIKHKSFGLMLDSYPHTAYRLKHFLWALKLIDIVKKRGLKVGWRMFKEFIVMNVSGLFKKKSEFQYRSLRRIVEQDLPDPFKGSEAMIPLRKGR